jgi:IS5 family transposase
MIKKIIATPANVMDDKILENILPTSGAILGDKGFDTNDVMKLLEKRELHSMIIKKNNRKDKNKPLDYFITKLRSPFEGIFTCLTGKKNEGGYMRTYYRGLENVNFQLTFKALACNIFRLAKISDGLYLQGIIIS